MQNHEKEREKENHSIIKWILAIIILILLCLCCYSCSKREKKPIQTLSEERTYEENCEIEYEDIIPTEENKRLNIAISDNYRISDEKPKFYIGFPEENIFDVVFTLQNLDGEELYRTDYIAPGTNVAIEGTQFLEKGEQQIECVVSIYNHDSGMLISDCTTVVLNVIYE